MIKVMLELRLHLSASVKMGDGGNKCVFFYIQLYFKDNQKTFYKPFYYSVFKRGKTEALTVSPCEIRPTPVSGSLRVGKQTLP